MDDYFPSPFPFREIIQRKQVELNRKKLNLGQSIRANIRSLILMRVGEFAYDRKLGFEMWDYDKQVFYHEREPYFENRNTTKGLLENATARKHFKDNLFQLIAENEIRLNVNSTLFTFEKVEGNMSVYQRRIVIKVEGRIKSTGKILSPPFIMRILYSPFQVETN